MFHVPGSGHGDIEGLGVLVDPNAIYSDNGHLTTMGFVDADTVLLLASPADFETGQPDTETWHLVTWQFLEGTFERVASGSRDMRFISVAPALMD
ncbi:MAG: hypothetical protein Q8O61_05615 [Nocardioides sp.]|nr:hypothetical protein [Nocardioides sp.]